jgi:uncharacterized protein (TIGR03089 family)
VTTPWDLLADLARRDGARPLVTFYDDATGERVELSVTTTSNWVAKTAGYLVDEHGLDPGDTVSVTLPVHWQAAVIVLSVWAAGGLVAFGADPQSVVAFTSADVEAGAAAVQLSLEPMGLGLSRLVAAQPDVFIPVAPAGGDLVEAAPTDLPHAARVLSVVPYDAPGAVGYGLVGPLAVDGSVVLVRNVDPTKLAGHVDTERITHTLGVDVDGLPRLDR